MVSAGGPFDPQGRVARCRKAATVALVLEQARPVIGVVALVMPTGAHLRAVFIAPRRDVRGPWPRAFRTIADWTRHILTPGVDSLERKNEGALLPRPGPQAVFLRATDSPGSRPRSPRPKSCSAGNRRRSEPLRLLDIHGIAAGGSATTSSSSPPLPIVRLPLAELVLVLRPRALGKPDASVVRQDFVALRNAASAEGSCACWFSHGVRSPRYECSHVHP